MKKKKYERHNFSEVKKNCKTFHVLHAIIISIHFYYAREKEENNTEQQLSVFLY